MKTINNLEQLVGIIGGTGPEATNYFTSLLTKMRGHVKRDQDHIPFLLFNNPQIPDRSKFLLYGGETPLPEMVRTGLLLKHAGATFIVITCNTAHAFVQEVEQEVGLPVVSLIEQTVNYISNKYGQETTVGVLATTGTIKTQIYQKAFGKLAPKISVLVPDKDDQAAVMKACYDIKKFSADEQSFQTLNKAAHHLIDRGAKVIILGCTEIPLALTQEKCDFVRVDPMEVLAKEVIKKTLVKRNIFSKKFPHLFLHR